MYPETGQGGRRQGWEGRWFSAWRVSVLVYILGAWAMWPPARAAVFDIPAGDVAALIAVINTANGNGEANTIHLAASTYTLTAVDNNTNGPNGLPSITSSITINGAGADRTSIARAAGAPPFRLLHVAAPGSLTLAGVTISGGRVERDPGGGLFNAGTLTLLGSAVRNNKVSTTEDTPFAGTGPGGGLLNVGLLTLLGSTISDNLADAGGGIDNRSTLTLTNSTVSDNTGGNEDATGGCGGIRNLSGTTTITNSTIAGNVAYVFGGGLCNAGTLILTNSTVSGNGASAGTDTEAGGVTNSGTLTITNSTITDNSAVHAVGGMVNQGLVTVASSIIAGNLSLGDFPDETMAADCSSVDAPLTSLGRNLVGAGGGCAHDGFGDLTVDLDAVFTTVLGPLQHNGGPTRTHALLPGSPALEAAGGNCPPPATDQRGVSRPQDGDGNGTAACDIGAYEREPTPPGCTVTAFTPGPPPVVELTAQDGDDGLAAIRVLAATNATVAIPPFSIGTNAPVVISVSKTDQSQPFMVRLEVLDRGGRVIPCGTAPEIRTVTTSDDSVDATDGMLSLREAITEAQAGDTIVFDARLVRNSIVLSHGQLTIDHKFLVIEGPEAVPLTIDGHQASRVFEVTNGARAVLSGLSISGGNAGSEGGGGISNRGSLTLTSSRVSGNIAAEGGGIANALDSILTITSSTISDNTASVAGGGIHNSGTLRLTHCLVSNNVGSELGGGGMQNNGMLTLTHSTVSANRTEFDTNGGGINNGPPGLLTIEHSTISDNAGGYGGGVFNSNAEGTITLTQSTMSRNTAHGNGGGVFNFDGTVALSDSTVSDNTAFAGGGVGNSAGTVTLTRSTVSGNKAQFGGFVFSGIGGGLQNSGSGTITVLNSTISGNTADSGGGMVNSSGGTLTLRQSTVSRNMARSGGGVANGFFDEDVPGPLVLTQTLLAGNTADNAISADCVSLQGPLTSLGRNLVGVGTGCPSDGPGDLSVDPAVVFTTVLGPLQFNGGPTETHALLPGSPAMDAGNAGCADGNGQPLPTDQRGKARPVDGNGDGTPACDIGAFEFFPMLNDLVTLASGLATSFHPTPVSGGPAGTFTITATFTNTSNTPLRFLFFGVHELSGGNLLLNADSGPGGVGATLTPATGDAVFAAGETVTVEFVIGLQTRARFTFLVDLFGESMH